jgi:hypothetical protein
LFTDGKSSICVLSSHSGNQEGKYNSSCWLLSIGCYRSSHILFTVLQFSNLTVAKQLRLVYKNDKKWSLVPVRIYISILMNSRICSLMIVKLSYQMWGKYVVTEQHSQATQHLSECICTASIVRLEDQPGRQSVIGESSTASS